MAQKINHNKKIRTKINHDGEFLRINKITILNTYSYLVTLKSGKNHEIRRIFRFNGLKIRELKREKIGKYNLNNMTKGQLSKIEI